MARSGKRDSCENQSSLLLMVFIGAVQLYRAIPRPVRCRRSGLSCSAFMVAALRRYGLVKGLAEGFTHMSECRPLSGKPTGECMPIGPPKLPPRGNAYYSRWLADETERKRMAAKWTGPR
jgi:putative component of membrane protein insertase Oxa1/YidC/SpoIIIJ protein YidD